MGQIVVGDELMQYGWVGDSPIQQIWLGDVLVWPTDLWDCDDKLLSERGFGLKDINPLNRPHDHVVRIDRFVPPHTDLFDIILDESGRQIAIDTLNNNPNDYLLSYNRWQATHTDSSLLYGDDAQGNPTDWHILIDDIWGNPDNIAVGIEEWLPTHIGLDNVLYATSDKYVALDHATDGNRWRHGLGLDVK